MKKFIFTWVCIIAILMICIMFSGCTDSIVDNAITPPTTSIDTVNSSRSVASVGNTDIQDYTSDNATKDGWTYFINEDDNYSIYKKNSEGAEKTKLSDDERVITLCIKEDYIYYTILAPEDGVPKLFKINVDGSDRQVVCDVEFLGDVAQENITSSIKGNSIFFKVEPLRQPTDNETDKKNEDKRILNGTHTYEVSLEKKSSSIIQTERNAFFYKNNISEVTYSGTFAFGEDLQKLDVKLRVKEVAKLKDGNVYELKLEPVDGVAEERLNLGYFFVQENTVSRFSASEENLKVLKSSGELPADSVIVCQEQALKDKLGEDEPGFHYYIQVDGNTINFHSYNNETETGYFESFVWEKNKGLVGYRSGFGAENDLIELQVK